MADNKQIAANVLEAVGGKSNVSFVTHCMTRLRFTLKDRTIPDVDAVKKINGVIGVQEAGGQFQVIIGQNVPKVYDELCALGGFAKQDAIQENLDPNLPKEKLTPALVGTKILNYLSGSMMPLIPVLMVGGLFNVIGTVVSPTMLNLMPAESDFVVLMNMMYNACFYFLPIYLGFNAARQLGATPALGALMGGVLLEPTFMQMAADGTPFSVYGIPCTPETYSQTVIPILLSVAVMSLFEKFFRKHVPEAVSTIFVPLFTMALALPFALCLLGPLGQWIGDVIAAILNAAGSAGGIWTVLAAGVLAAFWLPIIITGMHGPIIMLALANLMATGSDSFILVATNLRVWGTYAIFLACALKLRNKQERSRAFGYFITQIVGGVGEPGIYGLMLRYRKTFVVSIVTSFATGVLGALLHVTLYIPSSSNFLSILSYLGGSTGNLINACITAAFSFIIAFLGVWFFGFSEDELEHGPVSERS